MPALLLAPRTLDYGFPIEMIGRYLMIMAKVNLLIFALLSTLSYSQTTFARFPGRRSALLSPDRR
jgi:hypothetical protein